MTTVNDVNEWALREGMDVISLDGEKVGEVHEAMGEIFSVKEGWLFPHEHIIPIRMIASVDDETVHLGVTKDQTLDGDWSTDPPPPDEEMDTSPDTTVAWARTNPGPDAPWVWDSGLPTREDDAETSEADAHENASDRPGTP